MKPHPNPPSRQSTGNAAPPIKHYRELLVWQKSMQLCLVLYDLTRAYPREELYGLTSQMRRAAVSVMSNIAEGHGRSTRIQLAHFISIAKGSSYELEAQLLLARELGYGTPELQSRAISLCDEVGRMLHAMLRSLQRTPQADQTETR